MPTTTRDAASASKSGTYRVVGPARGRRTERPRAAPDPMAPAARRCTGAPGFDVVMSNPALTMNLNQAACMPSAWNVAMMSSVFARCAAASGSSSSSGGSCATSVRTRPGMPGDQRQPRHRATAGSEDVRGLGTQRIEHGGDVVGAQLGRGVLLGVVDRAGGDTPRVVGDDGVVGRERVGQRREFRRRHRGADDEHDGTGSAYFVVQGGAGDGQGVGGDRQGHTGVDRRGAAKSSPGNRDVSLRP